MSIRLNANYTSSFISDEELQNITPQVELVHKLLSEKSGAGNDFLGWTTLPEDYDKEEFARIKVAAEKIKNSCDIFIAIGIGGSYLGARAVIEFLKSPNYNNVKKDTPDIYFAGNNISAFAIDELVKLCEGKDVCINVISKSGTTTEPAIAFRVFRGLLEAKYGKEGARERIFVTTDKARGTLKHFSDDAGYETFVVPDDVGGRFSVLTAVGLLPIAATSSTARERPPRSSWATSPTMPCSTSGGSSFTARARVRISAVFSLHLSFSPPTSTPSVSTCRTA